MNLFKYQRHTRIYLSPKLWIGVEEGDEGSCTCNIKHPILQICMLCYICWTTNSKVACGTPYLSSSDVCCTRVCCQREKKEKSEKESGLYCTHCSAKPLKQSKICLCFKTLKALNGFAFQRHQSQMTTSRLHLYTQTTLLYQRLRAACATCSRKSTKTCRMALIGDLEPSMSCENKIREMPVVTLFLAEM